MVKATKEFKDYRCIVLEIEKKDYRKLQAGEAVKVDQKIIDKYPHLFSEIDSLKKEKAVKHGN